MKAFVNVLQSTIHKLEEDLTKMKRHQKKQGKEVGKSPRAVRRIKGAVLKRINEVTGQQHFLLHKQSPRKTSVQLDQTGVSLRKYSRLKGPHQPKVKGITKARSTLNEHATDIAMLLKTLVAKCQCEGSARESVSRRSQSDKKLERRDVFPLAGL